jgi:hypothetical protein
MVKEKIIMSNKRVTVDIEEQILLTESINVRVIKKDKVISESSSIPSATCR